MCIRDSSYTAVSAAAEGRRTDSAAHAFALLVPYLERPCFCLLYTSDAADDLLCVDLGGRRIIKKKKNIPKNQNFLC